MPLLQVSSPFDYILEQTIPDIERVADAWREIKGNPHLGHKHKALDALEASLLAGHKFVHGGHHSASLSLDGAAFEGGMMACLSLVKVVDVSSKKKFGGGGLL